MANSKQAKKRARQAEKRRQHNASRRSMMRTYIKRVIKAVDGGDLEKAQAEFKLTSSVLHRLATRGLVHKNKAARHISRLNSKIKALSQQAAA